MTSDMSEQELAQTSHDSKILADVLERLRHIREQSLPYPGDILADVRAERERQIENVRREITPQQDGEP